MKRTSSNSLRSAWWHICFTISPSTSSVWIHIALPPPHDRFLSFLTILTKHQAWAPAAPMLLQNKVRFIRAELRFRPNANASRPDKDMQNTWWNHLRFIELHAKEISTPSTTCSHTSAHTHISCGLQWNETNKLKFTQICMMDLAHLSTNPLYGLPLTHVTISPSTSSVRTHIVLPLPPMTDSLASSPSSPNTKPEPRHHQCCCDAKPGLSGSSCASVLLPMPASRPRSAKYVVNSSTILWNSHKRNLSAFYRILFILPLILTYHVVCNEMKWTSSNSLRSAWWTWHISAPIV